MSERLEIRNVDPDAINATYYARNGVTYKLIKCEEVMTKNEAITIFKTDDFKEKYGRISIELWPEGLVVWVGGMIKYESWK